jgi:methylation protein EvaC
MNHHGLGVVDVQQIDSQGGSIRVTCKHHDEGILFVSTEVSGLLQRELDCSHGYAMALQAARYNGETMVSRLRRLRATGKRICGYGAPAKLTTLCYALGIERNDLDCVFDDNPLKIGKFTPGKHIPIVSSAELAARAPDVLVLFSGNYADEIKAKTGFKGEWICV